MTSSPIREAHDEIIVEFVDVGVSFFENTPCWLGFKGKPKGQPKPLWGVPYKNDTPMYRQEMGDIVSQHQQTVPADRCCPPCGFGFEEPSITRCSC